MKMFCAICNQLFHEGEEVSGIFMAYYHEIPSDIHFSVSAPHQYEAESLQHTRCTEVTPE